MTGTTDTYRLTAARLFVLAVVALLALAAYAAPSAMADPLATQYELNLPGSGDGLGSDGEGGDGPGGTGDGSDAGSTDTGSDGGGVAGGAGGSGGGLGPGGTGEGARDGAGVDLTAATDRGIGDIAADATSDGGVPLLLIALGAIGIVGLVFLAKRNGRTVTSS